MFNGSFSEILKTPLPRASFESDLLPTLSELRSDARFIALGRSPSEALIWRIKNGRVRRDQLLGAFPHPSGSAGSQVDCFVGKKRADQLTPGDPVRHRLAWLDCARAEVERAVADILRSGVQPHATSTAQTKGLSQSKIVMRFSPQDSDVTIDDLRGEMHAVVRRGKAVGTILYPHVHKDGRYVVSLDRYKKNYIRVETLDGVKEHLRRGLSVRMSNQNEANHRAPSLIAPSFVAGWR
jgi:hypothetical protein